jgi:hypothetical protein
MKDAHYGPSQMKEIHRDLTRKSSTDIRSLSGIRTNDVNVRALQILASRDE